MIRAVEMGGVWYTYDFFDVEDQVDEIQDFVLSGSLVVICEEVSDLQELLGDDIEIQGVE